MYSFMTADASLLVLAGCRTVQLTKGYVALIDETDWPIVAPRKWSAIVKDKGGLVRIYARCNYKTSHTGMHAVILDAPRGVDVDHKSADGLDNTRGNIRLATRTENNANSRPSKGRRFKGVYRIRTRWRAYIRARGSSYYLGCFGTPEEAARCYDRAAIEHFGEFARLNLPAEASASA